MSRNPPNRNGARHPALDTSEDSESDSRKEEMQPERRYPLSRKNSKTSRKMHIILLIGVIY
jgi:hypothetical protein